jgi:hypothetical protein
MRGTVGRARRFSFKLLSTVTNHVATTYTLPWQLTTFYYPVSHRHVPTADPTWSCDHVPTLALRLRRLST